MKTATIGTDYVGLATGSCLGEGGNEVVTQQKEMSDPIKPSAALLCKLGSIAVHVDELADHLADMAEFCLATSLRESNVRLLRWSIPPAAWPRCSQERPRMAARYPCP